MNPYFLLRPFIFSVDPETAHDLTIKTLRLTRQSTGILCPPVPDKPVNVMGITFKNPVGLAAGFDKNGECLEGMASLGFGFLEIGTVTPRPQPGNVKPRLFRLPEHQAIINRLGFNNKGIDYLLAQVERSAYTGVLGINIGKNADTPIEHAADDYLIGLQKAYRVASYITVNISSPNTQNLRQLQHGDELKALILKLKNAHSQLQREYGRYVPLVLKIAPDLKLDEVQQIAQLLLEFEIDGVIATNTTLSREGVAGHIHAHEMGGLSGKPLNTMSTQIIQHLASELKGNIPIIAVGGILSGQDAQEKIAAGASLVQVYTGLVYQGAALIHEIVSSFR